uniref:Uncharacterized protein n=1 Tax=Globisporangium ultimum (strain ATCC 200006 / CBS 805.95 / DAOM BR144) TaxID=431595 RepID=K3X771_GLOUD
MSTHTSACNCYHRPTIYRQAGLCGENTNKLSNACITFFFFCAAHRLKTRQLPLVVPTLASPLTYAVPCGNGFGISLSFVLT